MCGKSMNYIQKIEGGDRMLPDSTAGEIYEALGFNPAQVPFNTSSLLDSLRDMDDEDTVTLGYVIVDSIVYFNLVVPTVKEVEGFMPTTVKFAKLLLESQLVVFG